MNRGMHLSRNPKYRPSGISRGERIRWAEQAVRDAEVKSAARPDDRALKLALESRKRELIALLDGRKR